MIRQLNNCFGFITVLISFKNLLETNCANQKMVMENA